MSLFINQDQIFAHQVHLLEHKLRSKEERILELETEKAILHLRLAECLGRLRRGHEGEAKAKTLLHHQREAQSITQLTLGKLLAEVQNLKQVLSEIFAVYANGVAELEGQSKQILEKLDGARATLNSCHGDDLQSLQSHMAALERDLVEEKERCRAEKQRRREIHNTLVELRGNIRVHCRVRPVLPLDQVQSCSSPSGAISSEEVIHVSEDTVLVNCIQNGNPAINKVFEFERVHGPEDSQNVVFEEVKPLLTSLLDGYNVCIMAYGQTGSGKTHTMMGSQGPPGSPQPGAPQGVSSPGDQQGIIPQAAVELFRLISGKPSESHVVEVSVVEVYNNEVFDLLSRDGEGGAPGQRRDVITTASGPSEVPSLTYECVKSAPEVMQLVWAVVKLRARCPTLVHAHSSRSHLVVTLTVSSNSPHALALARRLKSAKQELQRCPRTDFWSPRCRRANGAPRHASADHSAATASPSSSFSFPGHSQCPSPRPGRAQGLFRTRLQLVDLAGSECVGMSGVTGAALWETSCINRSLCALSDVLGALAEQRPHVPYRNSKLTHLLQDAIGGDAKLLVMLCISPAQRFISESLQSLGFGSRARQFHKKVSHRKNDNLKQK
ncbi:kinesin-like protein KIF25 [Gadus chalcogrammus]|uniref:kinesin-like protein KIF25 n=1 Tax=Gadus chalcogrammus TaxID=1042646 RepID=UPI0024C4E57B|nr:kinesin-like protein KIF25 [Gadus chalcogrammus]